jgi:hypothetical protein
MRTVNATPWPGSSIIRRRPGCWSSARKTCWPNLTIPYGTGCEVIRVFAKALYCVTGTRPVDPNWDTRGRDVL